MRHHLEPWSQNVAVGNKVEIIVRNIKAGSIPTPFIPAHIENLPEAVTLNLKEIFLFIQACYSDGKKWL